MIIGAGFVFCIGEVYRKFALADQCQVAVRRDVPGRDELFNLFIEDDDLDAN